MLEERIGELENQLGRVDNRLSQVESRPPQPSTSGGVGIGTIVAHTLHQVGSTSVAQMREAGFAVCDGTTPASQGIANAVLTGATPDLTGRFLRGAAVSGELQADATAVKGLSVLLNQTAHTHAQSAHTHGATLPAHTHTLANHAHGMDHTHLTHITDSNGFCNPNAVQGSQGDLPNTTDWARASGTGCHYATSASRQVGAPLSGRATTDGNNGNTGSAAPAVTIDAATATNSAAAANVTVALMSNDTETRPANMTVVWMMRVR